MKNYRYIIGIDPGVDTGFAVFDRLENKLVDVCTIPIHAAMYKIVSYQSRRESFFVRAEDARKRKWFNNSGREQLQGAGSIKRDSKIWEDFLSDISVSFEMVHPKNNKTKVDAETFKKITGWAKQTNEHGRDAAFLCFQYKPVYQWNY